MATITREESVRIATAICEQIGKRALFMLGVNKKIVDGNSLILHIRGSKAYNRIRVTYNSMDWYDMEFTKVHNYNITRRAEENGLYGDMLCRTIERHTGLRTSL